jgi:hypothetical protein
MTTCVRPVTLGGDAGRHAEQGHVRESGVECFESECCDLTGEDVDGICIVLDPAAPPSLSGYCQSACHITDDCADGTVCLHPSPCDGDPRTKGVCTLVEDAPPTRVECPDERP